MPILAVEPLSDTSLKIGSLSGNEPPTATSCSSPLTEIVACRATGRAAGWGAGWTVVPPSRFSALLPGSATGVGALGAGVSETCWTKGSLLSKRSNETSCPSAGTGAGSESTSAALTPAGVGAGVGVGAGAPGVTGVGTGTGAGVAEAGSDAGVEPPPKALMIVGAWKMRTPTRTSPSAPAMIFWRLAFALGSNLATMGLQSRFRSGRAQGRGAGPARGAGPGPGAG